MATTEDVKKLAALARISLPDGELAKFASEFDAILAYVGQLEALDIKQSSEKEKSPLRNVMRADGTPHKGGAYTEKLAAQFPAREGDALSVKKVIHHG